MKGPFPNSKGKMRGIIIIVQVLENPWRVNFISRPSNLHLQKKIIIIDNLLLIRIAIK